MKADFREKVDQIEEKLTSIERTCAIVRLFHLMFSFSEMLVMKSHNMSVADGQNINFKRVPLADGSDPVTRVGFIHTTLMELYSCVYFSIIFQLLIPQLISEVYLMII
jgi:hypothetical protein